MLSRSAQGNLTQRKQIAFTKKVLRSTLCLLGQINLAGLQAGNQLIGGDINQNDFISVVQHRVGHGFMHAHTCNSANRSVQTFKVLNIDR